MRVLMVVPHLGVASGVSSFAINYYKVLTKKEDVQIDFICLHKKTPSYENLITGNGGNIVYLPNIKKVISFISMIKQTFKKQQYDIIHLNVINIAPLFLIIAKYYGVNNRILHSHFTKSGETKLKEFRNNMLTPIAVKLSNHYFACTKEAGEYIFKKKFFYVIKNVIEFERFSFDIDKRKTIRKKMCISDSEKIIGVVGRIAHQKNPFFILQIMKEIIPLDPNIKLWWVGDGPLNKDVRNFSKKLRVESNVSFLGNRDDVQDMYLGMDMLLLPSKYEGLGMVAIEAQASGLPVLCSNMVPKEVKISENCIFQDLSNSPNLWAGQVVDILSDSKRKRKTLNDKKGYDLQLGSDYLYEIYKKICSEEIKKN